MKLAISNIAWEVHDDPAILELLRSKCIMGIEVAPTKLWPDWKSASYVNAVKYKKIMQDNGFEIPAMQAILFGKPDLQLFDLQSHNDFLEHIKLVSELANGFGSKVIVFGSPKNRKRGQIKNSDAFKVAAEFFYKAGEICVQNNCCIGLEHNPVEYGCDFITNMLDAKELVEHINHPGFKLHVDSAGLHMCGGDIGEMITSAGDFAHYHISEPMLEPIVDGRVDQQKGINTLKEINYQGWVSIEMKSPPSVDLLTSSLMNVMTIIST